MTRRLATPGDAIGGRPARWVATPANPAEVTEVVREAADKGWTMLARGTGSRQDLAPPPAALDLVIDTAGLAGLTDYQPGDLVLRVGAGTTMADIDAATATHGQQLAIDSAGTVGGLIASNTSGPRRLRYGTCRDLLIGVTVVLADGTVARSGGTVVKNVAGYDLGKLYTGSFGTLGVITEAVFRLHPRPAGQVWVSAEYPDPAAAIAAAARVRASQLAISALELDWPATGEPVQISALIEGADQDAADARAGAAATLLDGGAMLTVPPWWWGQAPWPAAGTGIKLSLPLSGLAATLTGLRDNGFPVSVRGSVGTGVLAVGQVGYKRPDELLAYLRARAAADGSAVVVRCPPQWSVDRWGPVPGLPLMRRIKEQFDPQRLLAPGRFVGGI